MYEYRIPRKQNLEYPEVRIKSMTVVFKAKSRSTVELSFIVSFTAVVSSKHGRGIL